MSVFGSLTTAVTGLQAQSRALGHLSDNIANSQTIGFKRVESSFQTLVTQSNANLHSPGGVRGRPSYTNDIQGTILQSDNKTSIAISGNGFFQVSQGAESGNGVVFNGAPLYTRAGDFALDRFGYLRNSSGLYLNGWGINSTTGNIERSAPSPIRVQQLIDNPTATRNINLAANLPLTPPANQALPAQTIQIIDNNGTSRDVQLNWRQQGTNNWRLAINAPGSQVSGTSGSLTGVADNTIGPSVAVQAAVAPVSQQSTVTITAAGTGTTYNVVLNGRTYSYTAQAFDTTASIAVQLFSAINAAGEAPGTVTIAGNVITLNGNTNGNSFTIASSATGGAGTLANATPTAAVLGVRQQDFIPLAGTAGDVGDIYSVVLGGVTSTYTTDGTESNIRTIAERLAARINADSTSPMTAQVSGSGLLLTAKNFPVVAIGALTTTNGTTPAHLGVTFGTGGVITGLSAANIGTGNAQVSANQNTGDPAFVDFTVNYGSGAQTVRLNLGNFGSSTNGLTQYAGTAIDTFSLSQDGFTRGAFRELEIRTSGDIVANYDNGRSRVLARVPVMQVTSPNSLQKVDGNAFITTRDSGAARADDAGANGAGGLVVSSLEGSNVDIAQEFTKMIVTQRAYSANTRVVTTSDEMLQETLNMKR